MEVRNGKTPLVLDEDYTVSYENNDKAGTATLIIKGTAKAENAVSYHGEKRINFTIAGTAMSGVKVNNLPKAGFPYTGEDVEALSMDGVTVTLKNDTLPEGAYSVDYDKNLNAGTATMILTGNAKMGYTGSKKVTFKIAPARLDNTYTIKVAESVDYVS